MGGDQVSRADVRPVLIYVRLVGVLVTREKLTHIMIVNMMLRYNLPLMFIPVVVDVLNDFIDESVFTVQLYSPASLLLIVTVTPTLIGSAVTSGTRFKSFSVTLNILSLTEHVTVVGGVFVRLK